MRVPIGSHHVRFEMKDCTINLPSFADRFYVVPMTFVILSLGRHEYRAISRPSGPRCVRVRPR